MKTLRAVIRSAACVAMVCAGILVVSGLVAGNNAGAAQNTESIYATYYGWYTNTPPGCATAYTGCAGGKGTYATPITSATDPTEFPAGTLFYYPTVEKYFVAGDTCTECVTTFTSSGTARIDLWMGGSTTTTAGTEFALIDCEDALTQTTPTQFVVTPPDGLPVSTQPLFTTTSSACYGGASYASTFARYQNDGNGKCLENPTYGTIPGVAARFATCSATSKGEDLEFDGDFVINHGLCLTIDTTNTGTTTSGLEWTACTGKTSEEFEQTSTTIQWIEYIRCVVSTAAKSATGPWIEACTTAPSDAWTLVTEAPLGLPSAPAKPTASSGDGTATVSWTASATPGNFPITSYVVTSTTGDRSCTWTSGATSCTVSTLTNGRSYTFTVTAHGQGGTSPPSAPSTSVTPTGGSATIALSSGASTAQTPTGKGWWTVSAAGKVTAYGAAKAYGTAATEHLNAPVVSMTSTATGKGYWLVGSDGGVFSFGAAVFHGSMGGQHLNAPIVGVAADQATGGYWLVASDGGVFAFTAPFLGSMGGSHLNKPVVGMASDAAGTGYWLAASDGGVFTFGNAGFYGSAGDVALNEPMVAMAEDPATGGYWLVAADGGVFNYGAPFYGSEGAKPPSSPVRGLVVTPSGAAYTVVDAAGSGATFPA